MLIVILKGEKADLPVQALTKYWSTSRLPRYSASMCPCRYSPRQCG